MIYNVLQTILVLIIFIITKYLAWKVTEEDRIPMFLHYEPYICYKCLSFWSLMALFAACGLLCHLWITMAVGTILTVLDTIAYSIHIKTHTVRIEEYDDFEPHDIPTSDDEPIDIEINGDEIIINKI